MGVKVPKLILYQTFVPKFCLFRSSQASPYKNVNIRTSQVYIGCTYEVKKFIETHMQFYIEMPAL